MPPLNFKNPQGQTLTVNSPDGSMPTERELDQMFSIKYGEPSVASQGISYVGQHPFKTALQPISKTITGRSTQERIFEPKAVQLASQGKPFQSYFTGLAGDIESLAEAPISYVPIPGAGLAGKIPVGSTNVGRIASNIAVRNPFSAAGRQAMGKSVQELQRLESALQQSGKLSSRGIYQQAYKEGIANKVFRTFVAAINPNLRKFKNTKDLQQYKNDVFETVKTINDYSPALQLKNPETEQVSNLPTQGRNIIEFVTHRNDPNNKILFAQALEQTKRELWKRSSNMSREVTGQGVTINASKGVNPILDGFIKSPQINTYRKDLVREAVSLKESYKQKTGLSPEDIENDLKFINQEIGKYWNGKDVNAVNFYSAISKSLRENVDNAIENALGRSGWQEGRNKYRALKNIESDIMRSAARTALKGDATMGDKLLDTFAGEELVRSLWKLDPNILTNAAAIKSFQILRGHLRSPDKRIADMFNLVKKSSAGPLIKNRIQNISQPARPFPFPSGPRLLRQPTPILPLLPYNRPLGLPSPRDVPYNPSGFPINPKPKIPPYSQSGPTIYGQMGTQAEIAKTRRLAEAKKLKDALTKFSGSPYVLKIKQKIR